ncbi:MAG: metallophosphoesterase [Myxococcota bacterium]
MTARMLIFFLVASAVWLSLHVYVGRRLLREIDGRSRRWGWVGVGVLAVVPVMALTMSRIANTPLLRSLQWFGFLLMGVSSILFFAIVALDVARAARRLWLRARPSTAPPDPSRRGFLARTANLGLLGGTGSITGVGVLQARKLPEVVEVDVPIEGLPPELVGYRIAQITDIHVGPTIRGDFLRGVVDKVNALSPDLIAVTGDLIDGYVDQLRDEVAPLGDLDAPDGTYFVTGNHEYYWDGVAWCDHVSSLGLSVLLNEHRVIERGGARILLAGVTDYTAGGQVRGHKSDPAAAREGAPACDVDILLAHQPRSVFAASEAAYDLQISGHTHGGQYFPMNIMVHLVQPYVAGLARHDDMWIYVSRGTAYWGPPLRVGAPHEITVLRLVAA